MVKSTNVAICFLFSFSLLLFVVRGPYRAIRSSKSQDFAGVYTAARCWMHGKNPYDHAAFAQEFVCRAGGPPTLVPTEESQPSVYPPTAMPILATLAWLPWASANVVWCFLSITVFAASLLPVFRSAELSGWRKWVLGSVVLAYSPTHTGIATGNPSVITNGFIGLAVYFSMMNRPLISGILLGIAQCLKPQLSICALAVLALWKCWLPVLTSVLVTLVAAEASLLRASSFWQYWQWCLTLRQNLTMSLALGGINDPSLANPRSYHLLNGQAIAGLFTKNSYINDVAVWILVGALIAIYLHFRSRTCNACDWRDLGFFSVVTIVVTYHRYYDAQIFLLLVPFLLKHWPTERVIVASLSVCLLFLSFPSQTAFAVVLGSVSARSLLGVIMLRHQPFAVLAMGFLLIPWLAGSSQQGERLQDALKNGV